jgi:predicted Zn-dependent peptidase
MRQDIVEERASRIASFSGIEIYWIKTKKFKTNSINVFFLDDLSYENVTKNSLIPAVLRRGCEGFPSYKDIALRLEELYGSSFDCGIAKKGEIQVLHFYTEFLSDRYTGSDTKQFEGVFDLLFRIITCPVLEDGSFRDDYLNIEKDNLKKLIASRVNDKMSYSIERCYEEMCKDEPFGIYEYGIEEEVDKIDKHALYKQYQEMLHSYPIMVYLTGDISDAAITKVVNKFSGLVRSKVKSLKMADISRRIESVTYVTEPLPVTQGKLSLGFRTNIDSNSPDYYALMLYNSILGVGTTSKLFQNVREKASLAYYAFSRLNRYKGLMVISSGIEIANKDKAMEIMLEQIEEMEKGKITDEEMNAALKSMETSINSMRDSQLQMVDFNFSQTLTASNDSFDLLIEKLKRVTRDDIIKVSRNIVLDTVYFLTSADEE